MKLGIALSLVLAAAAITPASANWFSNPDLGINRNVGSAPSPTPAQVRAERQPPFVLREQAPAVTVAQAAAAPQPAPPPPQPQQVPQQPVPTR